MTTCPRCDATWEPFDVRGVLYFQHDPRCLIEASEVATEINDVDRAHALRRSAWAWGRLTRPATITERDLLAHVGYAPTTGTPYLDDDDPGTLVHVSWDYGSIRRRTFPNLATPTGLPDPDAPWPPPRQATAPAPEPRRERPHAW